MKVSREKLQQIIQEELQQMDEEGELDEVGGLKALAAMGRSLASQAIDAGRQARIKAVKDEINRLQGQLNQLEGGAAQPSANIQRNSAGGPGSSPVAGQSKKVEIPRSDGRKTIGQTLSGEAAIQQLKIMGQNEEQIKQALQAIQAGTHSLVSFTDEKTGRPAAKLVASSQAKELAEMMRRKKLQQSKKRNK